MKQYLNQLIKQFMKHWIYETQEIHLLSMQLQYNCIFNTTTYSSCDYQFNRFLLGLKKF